MAPENGRHDLGAEQATKRKRGSRGGGRRLRRQIERAARERQQAWQATGQPNVTGRLTAELDDLYVEYRADHSEPGGDFRRPTPEMRADAGKPRKPKHREPKVSGPAGPITVTKSEGHPEEVA